MTKPNYAPIAFKYITQMHSPRGPFTTFNVPTRLIIERPGHICPIQGRIWSGESLRERIFLAFGIDRSKYERTLIAAMEVFVDRDDNDYELMGYALINYIDLGYILKDNVLKVNILTA